MTYAKIHPIALGLTLAILAGLATFFAGLIANVLSNGKPLVSSLGTMYITIIPSIQNSALGGVMAFVGSLIGGYIAAWIYNILSEYI